MLSFYDILLTFSSKPDQSCKSLVNLILGSDCPRRIAILSSGRATTWEEKLGSYTLLNYDEDGRAVYENDLKNGNFLFSPKNNDATWMVSIFFLFLTIPIKTV